MDGTRAATNARRLIDELGRDLGRRRGWQRRVAEMMGWHPSYVSRVFAGALQSIGEEMVTRACENLKLSADYFDSDPSLAASWRDHLSDPDHLGSQLGQMSGNVSFSLTASGHLTDGTEYRLENAIPLAQELLMTWPSAELDEASSRSLALARTVLGSNVFRAADTVRKTADARTQAEAGVALASMLLLMAKALGAETSADND